MGKNKTRSKSALKQNSVTAENKRLSDDGNINFTFKILSAIGIIIIVSGHCYNGGVSLMYDWFPKYSYNLALFVFISGYFYKEKHEEHIFKYIWGRTKRLLIPAYLWKFQKAEEYKMEFVQVVSVENMRKSDARTIAEHTPSAELMYRAAQGIFNSAKFVGKVAIVCGKGNNGGDGYALACVLCKNGFTPTIFRASDGFSKDGLYYYKTAMSLGAEEMPMSQAAAFTGFDIVVDCLLGTGFSGELKGEMLEAVEQINMTNAYVISADINSGINGDTGVCSTAVNSDLTVSIGSFKTGLFLNDAPYYIGSVTNCDIGISLIEDEYKLIDYSLLHMFEGYGSLVMTAEEFFEKYGYEPSRCNVARCVEEISKKERRTVVVKTDHSAVIADLKYIYFCADYVINN
jgi:hydroxyethylthiazole kinase-like uncharacterized protein yjeF